jgi:hypothetical protein
MDQQAFEERILGEMSAMRKLLAEMSDKQTAFEMRIEKALVETNGKLKGNHELILSEIHSYVSKDKCENHRQRHGERMEKLERETDLLNKRVEDLEKCNDTKSNTAREALISWMPSIITALLVAGGIFAVVQVV